MLLLVGSPRGEKSTSFSLGNYICQRLKEVGFSIDYGYIHRLVTRKEKQTRLIELASNAELIILSFPLYVDQLPAPVINAMELLYKNKDKLSNKKEKKFLAIGNCGFPEAFQIDLALEICQNFSKSLDFKWLGGIKMGGGEFIHGRDLENMGKMVQELKKGLNIIADALTEQQKIPEEAINIISKNIIPSKWYKTMGNLGWRVQGLRNKNIFNLKDQPYRK